MNKLLLMCGASAAGAPPAIVWPPPPRAPLPSFPPGQYDRVLPFMPPSTPDLLFYRGNFCGIRAPGIGLLPGMAGFTVAPWNQNQPPHCPPFMAQDIQRYFQRGRLDECRELLRIYAHVDGYTHLQCNVGTAIEENASIDTYVTYAALAQSFGLFADHWFLPMGRDSHVFWQDGGARDGASDYWRPLVQPWLDALKANRAIDAACVGWQLDGANTGTARMVDGRQQSPIQSIIDYFADQLAPHGIPIGTHWINEAGAWNDPFDRFRWWRDEQRNKLSWFHHQGDVDMDIPLYQAKMCDTLEPFGNGRMGTSGLFGDRPYGLVVYECSAQKQFDLRCSEDEGDLRGYLLCCTKAASHVSGYGNGARRPDGSAL